MFDYIGRVGAPPGLVEDQEGYRRRALSAARALGRPVALAGDRLLPVDPALAPLLVDGGLRRGSSLVVGGVAGTSLALALAAGASRTGSWVVVVGVSCLGARAAAQLGVDLGRLALVPDPGGQWPMVAAAVLEAADVVVVGLPDRGVRPADSRRLTARARERGAVVVVLDPPGAGVPGVGVGRSWPEPPDLRLEVGSVVWEGLGPGHGYLRSRVVTVTATGRRGASRARKVTLLLPGPDGRVAAGDIPAAAVSEEGPGPGRAGGAGEPGMSIAVGT